MERKTQCRGEDGRPRSSKTHQKQLPRRLWREHSSVSCAPWTCGLKDHERISVQTHRIFGNLVWQPWDTQSVGNSDSETPGFSDGRTRQRLSHVLLSQETGHCRQSSLRERQSPAPKTGMIKPVSTGNLGSFFLFFFLLSTETEVEA